MTMPDANAALIVLIVLVVVNTLLRLWFESNARAAQRKVAMVLDVLLVWADTWGKPPDEVKKELTKALHGRRKTDQPRRIAP